MLLEITVPPSIALVAAVWLQRAQPTAARVDRLEAEVAAAKSDMDTMRAALTEAQRMIDRLADQRMG
jgi:outer membrane murein-binding lipoprotein Lpp